MSGPAEAGHRVHRYVVSACRADRWRRDMQRVGSRRIVLTMTTVIAAQILALSQGGGWTPNGSMPFERGEVAVAAVNDKIYVISGSSRGVEANAFNQEFDP